MQNRKQGEAIDPQSPTLVTHFLHQGSTTSRLPYLPKWCSQVGPSVHVHEPEGDISHSNHNGQETERILLWHRGSLGKNQASVRLKERGRKGASKCESQRKRWDLVWLFPPN